jgi:hypothetical protein
VLHHSLTQRFGRSAEALGGRAELFGAVPGLLGLLAQEFGGLPLGFLAPAPLFIHGNLAFTVLFRGFAELFGSPAVLFRGVAEQLGRLADFFTHLALGLGSLRPIPMCLPGLSLDRSPLRHRLPLHSITSLAPLCGRKA